MNRIPEKIARITFSVVLAASVAVSAAGCGRKKKTITDAPSFETSPNASVTPLGRPDSASTANTVKPVTPVPAAGNAAASSTAGTTPGTTPTTTPTTTPGSVSSGASTANQANSSVPSTGTGTVGTTPTSGSNSSSSSVGIPAGQSVPQSGLQPSQGTQQSKAARSSP
ncbi:MAG: hypothetical protein IJH93_04950 [Lachnospiraceae bacterium]|nr:hypothetical protein [Lachnospiraceae bacterium]